MNWLNTNQGYPAAYKFITQPGDPGYNASANNIDLWQAGDPGYDANNLFQNSLAHYFLPSVDEWYKAAFYDPNANDGAGGYWNYPTGSDGAPTPIAWGTDPGTAVYISQGPADIAQAGGLSPYGTMAQAGNVWEWEETEINLVNDAGSSVGGVRGGCWSYYECFDYLSASDRCGGHRSNEDFFTGFRVASIPEPSTGLLRVLGMLGLMRRRRRLS